MIFQINACTVTIRPPLKDKPGNGVIATGKGDFQTLKVQTLKETKTEDQLKSRKKARRKSSR